jgi:hypothetical protein
MGWQDDAVVQAAPSGAQPAWAADPVVAQTAATESATDQPKQSLWDRYKNSTMGKIGPLSVIEPVMSLGSGLVATPVAGIAGIGASATNALGLTDTQAGDVVEKVSGAMTYEPRTPGGQIGNTVVQYPFQKLAQFGNWAGENTAEGSGSPAVGAAVNTGIQFLPALLLKGRGGGKTAAKPNLAPAEVTAQATQKAQEFVGSRTSLDWNSLSTAVKTRLTDIAKDAGNLDKLDAKAVERQAQLESLPAPVTATRGQLTRDPVQLRNEGNVSATEAGKPIRDTYVAQTQALLQNLDILKGKVSGKGKRAATAETPEQVGRAVQDEALRAKAAASKRKYDFLYKKARATEPDAAVHSGPLQNMLESNPELQHLGFMQSWFSRAKIDGPTKQVRLAELQDLRDKAGGIASTGGTDGFYAGKVVRAIDEAMEQVPAAAKSWREAQGAFKKHKTEFEEQGAVERLVTDKSRTDRATALEDTWRKTVIGGSIEDLQKVKRSLLTGEDQAAKGAGIKAWRDMRAQTVQHIINEATKSVTRYEDGTPNLTPASMERAIKSIGDQKLNEIFGPQTVKQLKQIMEATRTVKTEPPTGFKGSPTLANVIALLEKSIGRVPVLGDTVTGTVKAVGNLKELGSAQRDIASARRTPLDEAAQSAAADKRRAGYRNSLSSGARAAPATQGRQ